MGRTPYLQSSFLVEELLLVLLDALCILWLLVLLNAATFLDTIPALLLGSNCQSIMSSIVSSTSPSTIVRHIPTPKAGNQAVLVNCLGENGLDHFQRGRIALDSGQNVEVPELGHVEHSLEHVLEFSTGADAETLEDIQHIFISQHSSCIKPLAAFKQEKLSLGDILPLNLGESLVAPEANAMLDGLLDLACHLEGRSKEIEQVGDTALLTLVKFIKLLLNLLVQFSAAGINEKNIQPTTGSPVFVGEVLVDTILA